jgi:hypothetical protein
MYFLDNSIYLIQLMNFLSKMLEIAFCDKKR